MFLIVIRDRKKEFMFLIITQWFAMMIDSLSLLELEMENQD